MNYQEWIAHLTALVDVPDYTSADVKSRYWSYRSRLDDIIRYHQNGRVSVEDCVRLLERLNDDMRSDEERLR